MATEIRLRDIAIASVAIPAVVGLCLWVLLLGPLNIGPIPQPVPASAPKPVLAPASTPERKLGDHEMAGIPDYSRPLVTQMQGMLIKKGYSVGPADADGNFNDNTLTALEAFQDDNALPVQPKCDQQCLTALGL